jgi:hypothetical protein
MTLTIIALLLFLAMVAAWVMLPGSMLALPLEESADPMPATASQPA